MAQPLIVALIVALGSLTMAILGLIGVLVTTKANFKLGKRTSDVEQQKADTTRIDQLVHETQGLRDEVGKRWAELRTEREDAETKAAERETEQEAWKRQKAAQAEETQTLRDQLRDTQDLLDRTLAERDLALLAQAEAEGGLKTARQSLHDVRTLPEDPLSQNPLP